MADTGHVPQKASSWLDSLRSSLGLDGLNDKSGAALCMRFFIATGLGFITGYFIKRFSSIMLLVILTIIVLLGLQHMGIIDIMVHLNKVQEFIGVAPKLDESITATYMQWAKDNIMMVLGFVVGFLFGIRLG